MLKIRSFVPIHSLRTMMSCLCPGPAPKDEVKVANGMSGSKAGGASGTGSVRVVEERRLFVTEPNPTMFGNGPNASKSSSEGQNWTNKNWLKSRFHFNFAEYHHGPGQFGFLRVMNDDLVQPKRGFGTHPHRDMEIMTFIINGYLTHKDSMGTEETLGRGGVQFMTAGRGIRHSEHNLHDEPLRFVQCWVMPRSRGLAPAYGSHTCSDEERRNRWALVASDAQNRELRAPVQIQQDCSVYVSELKPGNAPADALRIDEDRQAYLLCVEGSVQVIDNKGKVHEMHRHDGAELKGSLELAPMAGAEGAFLLVFEMPKTHDRRSDF